MPNAVPRPCTFPGCGLLVSDGTGRCNAHRQVERRQQDERRGTAHERGYSAAWQRARAGWLQKHPLCAEHEAAGRAVAATIVDHKVPHRGDKDLFWDSDNWQSLCKSCHDRKTAREDGGFGRPSTRPASIARAGSKDG
ncbi:MAG: HNH endonuclease [Variovorax sp.]|nr:HNH endonuclease [Variovorax sp.]